MLNNVYVIANLTLIHDRNQLSRTPQALNCCFSKLLSLFINALWSGLTHFAMTFRYNRHSA